jgi:hypothetical protein
MGYCMPETNSVDDAVHRIVIIGSDGRAARVAEATGAHIVFVQKPGGAPDRLVWRNTHRCFLYSVHYPVRPPERSERFERFVAKVLGPQQPDWVMSAGPEGAWAAEAARRVLGLDGGAPAEPVRVLAEAIAAAGAEPTGAASTDAEPTGAASTSGGERSPE